jgi:FemAB-related protein (PEP-CTERM system-associated)
LNNSSAWDAFVLAHPCATLYHTWRWTELASAAFGMPVHRLVRTDDSGALTGVLPLVEQRSVIAGRRLVSLPYVNYGGPLGDSPETEQALIRESVQLAGQCGIAELELRDSTARPMYATRTDKVTVELALPADGEALGKALGAKLRSQIRRSDREDPEVVSGGAELLDEFYPVFAATMRDLGTPVYPRKFFRLVLERCGSDCNLLVVRLRGKAAAAALLTHFRDRTEIPWAASLHALRNTSVNMRLYWECLVHAIGRGSKVFDFGRSTIDSGTYQFKLQWGGQPRQLHWVYPLASGEPAPAGSGRMMQRARSLWTRLPLPVANALGPLVSPGLPW